MRSTLKEMLPSKLYDKIQTVTWKRGELNKAYLLIFNFRRVVIYKKYMLWSYMPYPSTLFRKVIGTNYFKVLEKLITNDILQASVWWNGKRFVSSYEKGRCRDYRLNPDLIDGEMKRVEFKLITPSDLNKFIKINNRKIDKRIVIDDLRLLIIDKPKLLKVTDDVIKSIDYSNFKIDNEIEDKIFEVTNHFNGNKYWTSHQKAMVKVRLNGYTLIKDDGRYYLDDLDRYTEMKKRNVRWNYESTIERLKSGSFYANRNDVNKRLDHNLTAVSKKLMQVILDDNELVEIDLANSQFAILAYLMRRDARFKSTVDFEVFAAECKNGTLYEYLKDEYSLPERSDAKKMMMEMAFSSHRYMSAQKLLLKKLFPSVCTFIDRYKKAATKKFGVGGHKRFSIMLQKAESKIFIDKLYYKFKMEEKLFIITKHDSFIVRKKDEAIIRVAMADYFKQIGFECTIK